MVMQLATVLTRAQTGMAAPQVTIEVSITGGLPALGIVGLVETAVRESRQRVRAAIEPPLDSDSPQSRRWVLALWIMAGLWLLLLAVPVLAETVQRIDDRVWEIVVSAETSVLVSAARLLDVVGGTLAMALVVVVVASLLAWRRRWPALAVWLVVTTASQALNVLIKELYERPRPPLPLVEAQSWSFVSGHALTAAAFAIALVLIWVPAGRHRRNLLIAAITYASVMAASRVYLRAHWFSDAFAGITVGAAITVAIVVLASWWEARSHS